MSTDFRGKDPQGLPLVSIVAVCYNHERFLEETLDSIKAQTYPNIQFIIMDDCSQDNSVTKIEEWIEKNKARCKFIAHKENKGLCKTLNEALEYCEGEYYQAIACDDIMLPDKLKRQIKLFENADQNVMVIHSNSIAIDQKGKALSDYGNKITKNKITTYEDLLKDCIISAPTALIRKKTYDTIGYYDGNLQFEDWDFWLRVAKQHKIQFINEQTIKYRVLQNSLSSKYNTPEYFQSVYLMFNKQIQKQNPKHIKNLINDQYKLIIKGLYILNKRYYWFKVIVSNKFSFFTLFHFILASMGFTYHQGTKIFKVLKIS